MTRRIQHGLLLLAVASMFISCSSRREAVATDIRELPPDMLVARVKERAARLVTMAGRGSVAFESPELGGSAFFELALKKPDSLLISFEGPFGIDAGFLFLSRQKFVMYNSLENRVASGIPSAAAIRAVIPFDLTFDQIIEAFTGRFPLPETVPSSYTVDEGKFLLQYDRGGKTHSYWIDPECDLVVRYAVRSADGATLLEAEASRIDEQETVCVPRHVTVSFPSESRRLSIHYASFDVNTPSLSFAYSIPSNARSSSR